MRILCLGSLPPPNHGQSIAFESALYALRQSGADCQVIETSFRSDTKLASLLKVLKYILLVPYSLFIFRPRKIYFLCSRSKVGGVRDLYLLFLCLFSQAEVFNHLHGSDFKLYVQSLSPIYRAFVIKLYKRVTRHAVLIDGMEVQLLSVANKNDISVVNNFYQDIDSIGDVFPDKGGSLQIVYLSSIMKSKGIFDLIDAVKETESQQNIRLVIAGGIVGDSKMNQLETSKTFYSKIENSSNIDYLGVIDKDKKYLVLKESHVLALPSYYQSEAVPLCIIEAMRMGCLILTTKYRYLPNLVVDGINGYLTEPDSVQGLVEKINLISNDRASMQRISLHNVEEAKKLYSEENYRKSIRKFLGVVEC